MHSSVAGRHRIFSTLAITNNAAVLVCAHVSVWMYIRLWWNCWVVCITLSGAVGSSCAASQFWVSLWTAHFAQLVFPESLFRGRMCIPTRGRMARRGGSAEPWIGSYNTHFLVCEMKLLFIKAWGEKAGTVLPGVLKVEDSFLLSIWSFPGFFPHPTKGRVTNFLICLVGIFSLDCCYCCVSFKHWN